MQSLALKEWRNPITIDNSGSMAEALKTFIEEDISAAPVVDAEGAFLRWLSLEDILALACQITSTIPMRFS